MESTLKAKYEIWMEKAVADPDLKPELEAMAGDEAKIEDAFYKDLEFGTAGLRGVIGAGTNRMNVYIVARASQGLSNYVINHFPAEKRSIAISYDSRIKSDVFAKIAAEVFAANGIKAYIFKELMPVLKPVVEKVASIINYHIKGHDVKQIVLVGGTSCLTGIEDIVEKQTGIPTYKPANPMFVTPLGIALSCGQEIIY